MVVQKTLESPLDARRSNQSILKEINPEYLLEGLILKLQYFGHLIWRADSLEKTLMLGKIFEGRRRRRGQGMRWLDGLIDSMDMSLSKLQEMVRDGSLAYCSSGGCKESDMTEWLNNKNKLKAYVQCLCYNWALVLKCIAYQMFPRQHTSVLVCWIWLVSPIMEN